MTKTTINADKYSLGCNSPECTKPRPTSPHLQIYKWEWTMVHSIIHRATAISCLLLSILSAVIIFTAKSNTELTSLVSYILVSPIGWIVSTISLLTIFYLIFAELKYMVWGCGKMLELPQAKLAGNISVALAFISTVGVILCYT